MTSEWLLQFQWAHITQAQNTPLEVVGKKCVGHTSPSFSVIREGPCGNFTLHCPATTAFCFSAVFPRQLTLLGTLHGLVGEAAYECNVLKRHQRFILFLHISICIIRILKKIGGAIAKQNYYPSYPLKFYQVWKSIHLLAIVWLRTEKWLADECSLKLDEIMRGNEGW